MTEVADVRSALLTRLQTITGLRASAYPPDQVNAPQAFVGAVREQFHDNFSGGSTITVDVVLLAAAVGQGIAKGYAVLAPYMAKTGDSSIQAAIEGNAAYTVLNASDEPIDYGTIQYIGASWTVQVFG